MHCGGKEKCRFRDPPQAENPAKQDFFLFSGTAEQERKYPPQAQSASFCKNIKGL